MEGNEEELLKEEGYALMASREIPFVSKPRLQVRFKEMLLKKHYEADLLVHAHIVVELKATGKRVGYLINFGAMPRLQWSRRVL